MLHNLSLGILLVAFCACSTVAEQVTSRERQAARGRFGERILLETMPSPVFLLQRSRDRSQTAEREERFTGPAYGARLAVGNQDQSIGLLHRGAFLESRNSDIGLDVQLFMLDFDVSTPVPDGLEDFYIRAGAAVGVARLDYERGYKDVTTAAAEVRIGFEYRPVHRFSMHLDVGGIALGEPGDTEAVGAYMTVGLKVTF